MQLFHMRILFQKNIYEIYIQVVYFLSMDNL